MNWLISSNPNMYDSISAFDSLSLVDWKQNANYEIGDNIYIYITKPMQKIVIGAVVVKLDIPFSETIGDLKFWNNTETYNENTHKKFARLKLLHFYTGNSLSLDKLLLNGLLTAPQGPMRLKGQLESYIIDQFNKFSDITYPDEIEDQTNELSEGMVKTVQVNQYERSPIARQKCIDYYGTTCQICGLDFEKMYGNIGRNFIHVHHKVPIANIGKEYVVDYKEDLIPVCPNCHAMLHRKNDNRQYYSPEELNNVIPQSYKFNKK